VLVVVVVVVVLLSLVCLLCCCCGFFFAVPKAQCIPFLFVCLFYNHQRCAHTGGAKGAKKIENASSTKEFMLIFVDEISTLKYKNTKLEKKFAQSVH